jgi:hypothetical protein
MRFAVPDAHAAPPPCCYQAQYGQIPPQYCSQTPRSGRSNACRCEYIVIPLYESESTTNRPRRVRFQDAKLQIDNPTQQGVDGDMIGWFSGNLTNKKLNALNLEFVLSDIVELLG